jgi:hypothetical protein
VLLQPTCGRTFDFKREIYNSSISIPVASRRVLSDLVDSS